MSHFFLKKNYEKFKTSIAMWFDVNHHQELWKQRMNCHHNLFLIWIWIQMFRCNREPYISQKARSDIHYSTYARLLHFPAIGCYAPGLTWTPWLVYKSNAEKMNGGMNRAEQSDIRFNSSKTVKPFLLIINCKSTTSTDIWQRPTVSFS